ncbi:MAG: hypothetical protein ACLRXR_12080 [Alistipes putredinis]
MSFILGVEESGYDWLYSDHDNELWGAVKTVYDPCPKGWKVPDKDVYADFMIGDDHDQEQTEALREAYGWNLTDGTMTSFFSRRRASPLSDGAYPECKQQCGRATVDRLLLDKRFGNRRIERFGPLFFARYGRCCFE